MADSGSGDDRDARDDHDAILSRMKITALQEFAKIYADVDAAILRSSLAKKFSGDALLYVLRDLNRLRLEAFEKVIGEMREERKRQGAIDEASMAERDPAMRLN